MVVSVPAPSCWEGFECNGETPMEGSTISLQEMLVSPPATDSATEGVPVNPNSIPCSFFMKGECGRGFKCPYLHPQIPGRLQSQVSAPAVSGRLSMSGLCERLSQREARFCKEKRLPGLHARLLAVAETDRLFRKRILALERAIGTGRPGFQKLRQPYYGC